MKLAFTYLDYCDVVFSLVNIALFLSRLELIMGVMQGIDCIAVKCLLVLLLSANQFILWSDDPRFIIVVSLLSLAKLHFHLSLLPAQIFENPVAW